jgi:hypothetical protein
VTAPVLMSDAALHEALASAAGVPNDRDTPDPRLEALCLAGRIALYGQVWRWRVRVPSQLSREQREYIADDVGASLREDAL